MAIAAITAAALLVGVERADERHRAARARFVDNVLTSTPIENYDLDVARSHARLLAYAQRVGRPRGPHDLIIAATAVATTRTIVTADAGGFADLPGVAVRAA